MSSVNKVIIIGNVGRDAELRYTGSGTAVCAVSVATSRSWKDQTSGERVEETEWHRAVIFDRLAEVAGDYLKKGRAVYLEGRLKTRKWTGQDAVERYTTEIVVG
jgi:single-strand DNA-binding protein